MKLICSVFFLRGDQRRLPASVFVWRSSRPPRVAPAASLSQIVSATARLGASHSVDLRTTMHITSLAQLRAGVLACPYPQPIPESRYHKQCVAAWPGNGAGPPRRRKRTRAEARAQLAQQQGVAERVKKPHAFPPFELSSSSPLLVSRLLDRAPRALGAPGGTRAHAHRST